MRKIYKSLILSFIFLSIGVWYLIIENTYYSSVGDSEFNLVKYHDNIKGLNIDRNIKFYTINPFDSYKTFIENIIIWFGMFLGFWFFFDLSPEFKKVILQNEKIDKLRVYRQKNK